MKIKTFVTLFIILLIAMLLGLAGCSTAENVELKENNKMKIGKMEITIK